MPAKDIAERYLAMYERFLETGTAWKGQEVTEELEKRFKQNIQELKADLKILEEHYPTDLKVYDRIDKIRY